VRPLSACGGARLFPLWRPLAPRPPPSSPLHPPSGHGLAAAPHVRSDLDPDFIGSSLGPLRNIRGSSAPVWCSSSLVSSLWCWWIPLVLCTAGMCCCRVQRRPEFACIQGGHRRPMDVRFALC
jgi:hypothetical protein